MSSLVSVLLLLFHNSPIELIYPFKYQNFVIFSGLVLVCCNLQTSIHTSSTPLSLCSAQNVLKLARQTQFLGLSEISVHIEFHHVPSQGTASSCSVVSYNKLTQNPFKHHCQKLNRLVSVPYLCFQLKMNSLGQYTHLFTVKQFT